MAYTLKFTGEGRADVRSLPKDVRNWIRKELQKLEADPFGCSSELREPLQQYRKFVCGEYRVIFMIFDDLRAVSIAALGKHDSDASKDVYRKLETLVREGKRAEKYLISMRQISPPR